MAGSFSDFLEKKLLDHVLGNTAYTAPATVYIGLLTSAPSDAGGGVEVTGGSYARVTVTNNTTNWPNASGTTPTTKTNGVQFTFPTASADWGTVVAFGLYDAASSGNLLMWATLTQNKAISNGDTASFATSDMTITLD